MEVDYLNCRPCIKSFSIENFLKKITLKRIKLILYVGKYVWDEDVSEQTIIKKVCNTMDTNL